MILSEHRKLETGDVLLTAGFDHYSHGITQNFKVVQYHGIGETMRVPVKTDNAGERFFEIPNELLEELGWQEGDELEWDKNDDGSYTLSKKHTSV
ncbi:AbrB/MazE/SpoVT family DNA-binding domain-containing protein [Enterovibrio norvegicus]|uniref:AbrB/MazE/SpoVT family DNA-binding domain-containing protein n=2 Tax=Enterovibrio norvegicus TaxID=188144 RepID=UPI000C85DD1B|nr:hypothetical protein [Enterovibrio norvegicus]PMI28021.1 hypothetical protein BCU47_02940 [Enterovibrio norvegicus]